MYFYMFKKIFFLINFFVRFFIPLLLFLCYIFKCIQRYRKFFIHLLSSCISVRKFCKKIAYLEGILYKFSSLHPTSFFSYFTTVYFQFFTEKTHLCEKISPTIFINQFMSTVGVIIWF